MRIYRCLTTDSRILHVTDLLEGQATLLAGDLESGFRRTEEKVSVNELLTPVKPTAIYGVGLNYRKHADELGHTVSEYPVIFAKMLNAPVAHETAIRLPRQPLEVLKADYEAELAVVIGKRCLNATLENALDFVAGYTCANDVSARDWQLERSGGQWSRGKSFDTFLPLGPCLVDTAEIPDPQSLSISARLNGQQVQNSHTSDMIFSIRQILHFLSADTTLEPGTVIITGTPEGVGSGRKPPVFLQPGDVIEVEISHIGLLRNPVV